MVIKELTVKNVNTALRSIEDVDMQQSLTYVQKRIEYLAEEIEAQAKENEKKRDACMVLIKEIEGRL